MVFKPGQSGNPGGDRGPKNKLQAEKLLPHVEAAVKKLVEGLDSEDDSIKLRAATEIMDRVYGKARQSVEHDATDNVLKIIFERITTPKPDAGS